MMPSKMAPSGQTRQVFVVGTGRCGTVTLAELLNRVPGCSMTHEVEPELLLEATRFLTRELSLSDLTSILRRTRSAATLGGGPVCGESNQRLSFVLPALQQACPDACYIHLIRDGREFVASAAHRGWYSRQETRRVRRLLRRHGPADIPLIRDQWRAHRVRGDMVGEMSSEEWNRLSPFARNCWYWEYTNRLIGKQIDQLGLRALRVRLEDLSGEVPRVLAFLNIESEPPALPRVNRAQRRVLNPVRPLKWQYWSQSQVVAFQRHAGQMMDEWYPRWREDWRQRDSVNAACHRWPREVYVRCYEIVASATRPLRERMGWINLDQRGCSGAEACGKG